MNTQILNEAGIHYEKGLQRFLGDSSLYDAVLAMFLDDATMADAEAAFESKDSRRLFAAVHALKGACGNVEMTEVYTVASALTELLRHGDGPEDAVSAQFLELRRRYMKAIDGIRRAMAAEN